MTTPEGFEAVRAVGARGFARPEAVAWVESTLSRWGTLARAVRHDAEALELQGRGVVRAVPAPEETGGGRWVVRRYLRGGWMAPLLHDRYLRRGPSRPEREARASDAARDRGIPTPRVVAGVVYPAGPLFYRADLVTRYVAGSVDLAALLFRDCMPGRDGSPTPAQQTATSAERAAALASSGRLARRMAEVGLFHPDLNAKNFLVVESGRGLEARVLDLDRARAVSGPVPLAPMAARLTRSLRKFETITGEALGEDAWAAFLDAIGDAP